MSATGYDIQKYIYCMEKVKRNNLTSSTSGDTICVFKDNGLLLGNFPDIEALFEYLCGYEAGHDKGKIDGYDKGFENGIEHGMEQVSIELSELEEFDLCEE